MSSFQPLSLHTDNSILFTIFTILVRSCPLNYPERPDPELFGLHCILYHHLQCVGIQLITTVLVNKIHTHAARTVHARTLYQQMVSCSCIRSYLFFSLVNQTRHVVWTSLIAHQPLYHQFNRLHLWSILGGCNTTMQWYLVVRSLVPGKTTIESAIGSRCLP